MGMTKGEWINSVREEGLENSSNRYYGEYPAVVSKDSDPQQQARIKVDLSLIGFAEEHPNFAYPITPYGGRNFGMYFPAHKDEVVWVTFDHGDPSADPMYTGAWYLNPGDNPESTEGDRPPEKSFIPAEFRMEKAEGAAEDEPPPSPTRRGIKSKGGSVWMFEDDPENYFIEFSSGKNPTTTEGGVETVTAGEIAEKHHRVKLDDSAEQIVIGTFGDENSNAEEASDEDSGAEKARKELESRLRHQILMRDKADDRFVEIKTVGTDDMMVFHRFLMSDTEELISLTSSDQHFIQVSDKEDSIIVETLAKFRTIWDEKGKKIVTETPGLQKITMDDNATSITIETASKQQIIQDKVGTLINEPVGKFDVIATTPSTHTYAAALTRTIGGAFTDTIAQALTVTIGQAASWLGQAFTWTGTNFTFLGTQMLITAPQVTIASANVLAGTGANQPLMNLTAMIQFNAHTHIVVSAFPGIAIPTDTQVMIPGVATTVALLGA